MTPEVIIDKRSSWGILTLNRPHVLNALSVSMMETLCATTGTWGADDEIQAVIIRGNGERAFCAGGDLQAVYRAQKAKDFKLLEHLFRTEYTFTIRLQEFPKPFIAFMHGICMGGGLGASVHGSHRIICPGSVVAMPEVAIGYIPDVGAAHFLNHAPGMIGLYLALTGQHVQGCDAVYAGIATYYIFKEEYENIYHLLIKEAHPSRDKISEILAEYHKTPPPSFLQTHHEEIDILFADDSLEAIMERLQSNPSEFAQSTLKTLRQRSPTSLKITFELMKQARQQSFRWLMNNEFSLSQKFVRGHDFKEGIRAAVIDKDRQPHWDPSSLSLSNDDLSTYLPFTNEIYLEP